MDVLQPVIRPYAWGSRTAIADLQGRPVPSAGPEAELWMGAHPSAPSALIRDGRPTTLDAVIRADPERELGARTAQAFGGRLPFLLKVLAADSALSIQLHPDRAQAREGFRKDNERGLAAGDPARNYVDDWPKPELLCALTPFEVLAGMRAPADAAALLDALAVDQLAPLAAKLAGDSDPALLSDALAAILEWPAAERPALIGDVVSAARRLAGEAGPYQAAAAAIAKVAEEHPGDIGIVAALLLRHAVIGPGEAVFMPAGGLHAYLRGTGLELLANSDNVIRAGLTGKHIDVPELLRLLDPAAPVPVLRPVAVSTAVSEYLTPAPEFRLYRADPGATPVPLPGTGPRIVLCLSGEARLDDTVTLTRGGSCFVSASDGEVQVAGPAEIYVAATGPLI